MSGNSFDKGKKDGTKGEQDFVEAAKANANTIEAEIQSLKQNHLGQPQGPREFWEQVRKISSMFKSLKPLLREDRERLWEEFSSICEAKKRELEIKREYSGRKRDLVESKIEQARLHAGGSTTLAELSEAESILHEALDWMKDGWDGFNIPTQVWESLGGNEGKLLRKDREQCWEKWKAVKEAIRYKCEEFYNLNYKYFLSRAYDALSTASHEPREAKSMVKEIQQELKGTQMAKPQFQEVHRVLNQAWETASSHLKEKHQEWLNRMQGHIERWSELIQKNEDVIASIERDIDKCQEMADDARTEEFAETARGWIEEKYSKIDDIRRSNQELEEKIRSVESKIH